MSPHRSAERAYGDIVRLAHSGLDSVTLRRQAAARLCKAVGATSYGFVAIDPATLLFTGAVQENIEDATLPRFLYNEYAEEDFNKVTALVTRRSRVGVLSAQTGGRLGRSTRFRTILEPEGWGDELRATFVSAGRCWGFICMHRDDRDPTSAPVRLDCWQGWSLTSALDCASRC
jgi:hypothetical protein